MKSFLIASSFVFLFSACPKKSKSLFDDQCPLSYKVEWTIVEEGVAIDKQIALLAELSAAAKADADKLNELVGNASAQAEFDAKFELSKKLQSNEIRKASVSQDVFDEYIKIRVASCSLWDAIKGGLYGDDEGAIAEARKLFTDIQRKFSELEEKKKKE
jgi:hypothetical protein